MAPLDEASSHPDTLNRISILNSDSASTHTPARLPLHGSFQPSSWFARMLARRRRLTTRRNAEQRLRQRRQDCP